MKKLILLASLFSQVHGEIKIITEQLTFGTGFTFEKIPAPATNDLGTTAKFSLIFRMARFQREMTNHVATSSSQRIPMAVAFSSTSAEPKNWNASQPTPAISKTVPPKSTLSTEANPTRHPHPTSISPKTAGPKLPKSTPAILKK
jgi:hypothetical protein